MGKIKCIICGHSKLSSIEHIIPRSLGNKDLITNLVCEECNSKMGEKIDGPFINNELIELKRNSIGLEGYKGKVPNPFKSGKDSDGNTIYVDNEFNLKLIPKVDEDENDSGFSILTGSKEEAYKIGLKKLKRIGASETDINNFKKEIEKAEVEFKQPKIYYEYEINFKNIERGFLKIAYVFMCVLVGEEYKNDKIGGDIRTILNQIINNETVVKHDALIAPSPPKAQEILKYLPDAHLMILTINDYKQMILSIFLFNGLLSYDILVSQDAQNYPDLTLNPIIVHVEK